MHHTTRIAGALATAALSIAPFVPRTDTPAALGDLVPDHTFEPLAGNDGRTMLSECFGQPVLLAGWKRHVTEGLHAASLADWLYRQYEDAGVVVILQDREKWSRKLGSVEDLDFWYRFYGTPSWITESVDGKNDVSIVREKSAVDVRSLVLIGVDGRLVTEVRVEADDEREYVKLRKELERALKDEAKKLKKGWGEDRFARKARAAAFGKSDLAGALKVLDGVKPDARVPEHDAVRAEVERRFEALSKRIAFLFDEGRYVDAKDALSSLTRSVKGREEFAERTAALEARLESDDGAAALALDKKLSRILTPWHEREMQDLDLDFMRALRAFAQEHAESPVGKRAKRMDPLAKRVVRILRGIKASEIDERIRDD